MGRDTLVVDMPISVCYNMRIVSGSKHLRNDPLHSCNGQHKGERNMNEPIYITGKCYWACVVEPNTKFEEHSWSIQVVVDDDNRPLIEKAGIKINNKDDERGDFVTVKRKVLKRDGTSNRAPFVKDSQNNSWDDTLIGNGSVVRVRAIPYQWKFAGKTGVSADLSAVQVIDLVSYTPQAADFPVVEGGYVNENAESVPF